MSTLVPSPQLAGPVPPDSADDAPVRRPGRARVSWLRRWVSPVVIVLVWQALSTASILS